MTPARGEICPEKVFVVPKEIIETPGTKTMRIIHEAELRLGYPIEGIAVDRDETAAHLVFQGMGSFFVLIDNGGNEFIPFGERRRRGFFESGQHHPVNWGGEVGTIEYTEVFDGRDGLVFPINRGYLLNVRDLDKVFPGRISSINEALERVTNQM